MAATQKLEVEQMRMVLHEMNNHPEARLFYSLQERGACSMESNDSDSPRLTLRVITDKVNRYVYPNMTAFVEDMTTLFSTCPNSSLATGAESLRELFTEVLSKYTNVLDAHETTPPGKKKRLRAPSSPIPYLDEEDPFALAHSDDDFADIIVVDDCFSEEFMHSTDRAALLELTEEIASIEAEIQQLKDTKQDLHSSAQPGFASHHSVLDALKTPSYYSPIYTSSAEEGRVALSAQQNKKRSRRNSNAQVNKVEIDDDWTVSRPPAKRRAAGNASKSKTSKQLQDFHAEIMTKEQLLNTITNDLPPKFLEGVIRIVNPTYDPASATDEDLEFDINLLDDDVLARLQQYVNTILAAPPQKKKTRPQNTKVTHKKETPKRRLQKEAPKKVNRKKRTTTGSRKRTTYTSKQKKQQQLLAVTLATRPTFVSAEHLKQVFMKEEIVRVKKSTEADEDEEVDILD